MGKVVIEVGYQVSFSIWLQVHLLPPPPPPPPSTTTPTTTPTTTLLTLTSQPFYYYFHCHCHYYHSYWLLLIHLLSSLPLLLSLLSLPVLLLLIHAHSEHPRSFLLKFLHSASSCCCHIPLRNIGLPPSPSSYTVDFLCLELISFPYIHFGSSVIIPGLGTPYGGAVRSRREECCWERDCPCLCGGKG